MRFNWLPIYLSGLTSTRNRYSWCITGGTRKLHGCYQVCDMGVHQAWVLVRVTTEARNCLQPNTVGEKASAVVSR